MHPPGIRCDWYREAIIARFELKGTAFRPYIGNEKYRALAPCNAALSDGKSSPQLLMPEALKACTYGLKAGSLRKLSFSAKTVRVDALIQNDQPYDQGMLTLIVEQDSLSRGKVRVSG